MMKRRLVVAILLVSTLFLSACSFNPKGKRNDEDPYFPEAYQVDAINGEVSSFGLNIAPADEMDDWVVDWMDQISTGDGFQYFVYSDPDSWDVYLCYPNNRMKVSMLTNDNIQVEFSGDTLKVYITENFDNIVPSDDAQDWVLHFVAHPFGTWPSRVELYWDDIEIPCDATKFDA